MKRSGYIKRSPIVRKKPEPRKKDRIPLAIPRPSEMKKEVEVEHVFRDGRTKINQLCKAGRDLYQSRKRIMWERQDGKCCLYGHFPECLGNRPGRNGRIPFTECVFEHENGRGGGKQDDRIEAMKDGKLVKQNGASCPFCNSRKGSRRIQYNDTP